MVLTLRSGCRSASDPRHGRRLNGVVAKCPAALLFSRVTTLVLLLGHPAHVTRVATLAELGPGKPPLFLGYRADAVMSSTVSATLSVQ